jgi:hypothetical protein
MGKVYRVGSHYGTEYFNTRREADRCKPGEEEPESFECVDAAGECNRLERMVDETESRLNQLSCMVRELLEVCPPETVDGTEIGRRAQRYCIDNPLPPATCATRDGQRSYGSG